MKTKHHTVNGRDSVALRVLPSYVVQAFFLMVSLNLFLGCHEGSPDQVNRFEDLGAPSVPVLDAGTSNADMALDIDGIGQKTDSGTQTPPACQLDTDCPHLDWCNSEGVCEPKLDQWIGPKLEDGLTRAAAAAFDLVPEGFEVWTDRAGEQCPDNRAGFYDGRLELEADGVECTDTFEDVDGDGQFKALWLGGPRMDRPASGIDMDNPPEGRVIVISRNSQVHVIVSLDVHSIGPRVLEHLVSRVAARTGLTEDAISLHVTGNRNGPDAVGLSGPSWQNFGETHDGRMRGLDMPDGLLDTIPIRAGVSETWLATVTRRMSAAIVRAAMEQRPIDVRAGMATFPIESQAHASNFKVMDANDNALFNDSHDVAHWRRQQRPFVREPALPGHVDTQIRIISLDDAETSLPKIIILGWGAAPAMNEHNHLLSADYPGMVRRLVEENHPGSIAVWLTTAASDTMVADRHVLVPESDSNGHFLDVDDRPVNTVAEARPARNALVSLASYIATAVPRALEGQPSRLAYLEIQQRLVWLPITNPRFGIAAWLGILPLMEAWLSGRSDTARWASSDLASGCGGLGCLRSRIDRVALADDVQLLLVPGALGQGYVSGRSPVTIHYEGASNYADLDGDGIDDATDDELMVRGRLGTVESTFAIDASVNPQVIDAVDGLGDSKTWVIGRTNGGIGSLRSPSQFVNVFEGQLESLERLARRPGTGGIQLCKVGYPCEGELTLHNLSERAQAAQPNLLANLLASREIWCEGDIPHLPEPTAWRIESDNGVLKAQGNHLTIGVNKVAFAPDVNFVSLGIEEGDRLILPAWDSRAWTIRGIVPIELKHHLNAADTFDSMSPSSGDVVYQAACELLDKVNCLRRETMLDDPNNSLPSAP